jgi:cytoplasmic tRNA 2-thiolation protein 1
MPVCEYCGVNLATLKRPKTGSKICKSCFNEAFESEIHETIRVNKLFKPGDRVAIGASGGKDSTVLARVLTKLNSQYNYQLDLFLLSVDEGITGYRDDSLESVKRNQLEYKIPLKIVSYKDIYGWTMDEIVKQIGTKNNCSYCGIFRRQALDRGAALLGAQMIVTGHNADDMAETVLMNILRGDIARLDRCVEIITGDSDSETLNNGGLPRCKPFKYVYEKEIVLYAYYNHLDYFSTECIYSPFAYRGFAREYLKELEKSDPKSIIHIIQMAEGMHQSNKRKELKGKSVGKCTICGFISSNSVCKACILLEGLNKGRAKKRAELEEKNNQNQEENNVQKGISELKVEESSSSSLAYSLPMSSHPMKDRIAAPMALAQAKNANDW